MIIDRHRITRGQVVWALIEGEPKQVAFNGLMPYRGFAYVLDDTEQETHSDAVFADSLDALLDEHIRRREENIQFERTEIGKLNALRTQPHPATQEETKP